MCRGVLPYDLTTLPLVTGISNFQELDAAVPYFDYILRSGCSPRSRQFICSLLEPECKPKGMKILPPCRRACKGMFFNCIFVSDEIDSIIFVASHRRVLSGGDCRHFGAVASLQLSTVSRAGIRVCHFGERCPVSHWWTQVSSRWILRAFALEMR